ncbi:DUF4253 domain-containing protein [Kitasatospora sp. NPDC051914]|uniref:DUF4253 domain-containing protein n=1 Tax=Kitasatospora sp. NPDC051914 TaxID=3154945 RepID=UPI0034490E41
MPTGTRTPAARLLGAAPGVRIGLVPAADGAEALTVCGWTGPVDHEGDTARISAVLADRRRRLGAEVVGAGFDTLRLNVAAPPRSTDDALRAAAERTALRPDSVFHEAGSPRRSRSATGRLGQPVPVAGLSPADDLSVGMATVPPDQPFEERAELCGAGSSSRVARTSSGRPRSTVLW